MLGKGAGVDIVNTRYFFFLKPVGKRTLGEPVAVVEGIILRYDSAAVYARTFVVIF
jgi:hypothetical protein